MKLIIALSILVAVEVVSAISHVAYYVPAAATSSKLPLIEAPLQQHQYHIQDDLGQYSYGYSDELSSKQEVHLLDGVTHGSYSYRDAEGKLQTVDYTADENGFHVLASNLPHAADNIPSPVIADTAEVAAARAEHLAAHERIRLSLMLQDSSVPSIPSPDFDIRLQRPVEDTPEVPAAKAEHLHLYELEKLRHDALNMKATQLAAVRRLPASASLVGHHQPAAAVIIPNSYSFSRAYLPSQFLSYSSQIVH